MKRTLIKPQLSCFAVFLLLACTVAIIETSSLPCVSKAYATGLVCVCNATYCDTLDVKYPEDNDEIFILSSSRNGLRFEESKTQFSSEVRLNISDDHEVSFATSWNQRLQQYLNPRIKIMIDRKTTFQKIIGFGNAFTGAVSHNLKLAPSLQNQIFKTYFSKETGIGLNIIRTPIGGCDFDLEPWAYNEIPENDQMLSNFTHLDWRDEDKLAQLKELMRVSNNYEIKFVGTAWSSPKWMKTNNEWTGFSSLKDEFYQTWAEYHLKYLELMHENGIDFWAITTGNEPLNGVAAFPFIKFMSLGWIPHTQAKWVYEYLGPTLQSSSIASKIKIIAGDDQRYTFPWWFDRMYRAYPNSSNFVFGHGVHWYWDKFVSAQQLVQSHERYPDKMIIATEACSGDKPWEEHKPILGYWPRGEDYVIDIMEDLNHFVNAWIDWNMILDEDGGPNYALNYVDTAIVVNTTNGEEFYKQPIFYAIGHFSKFLVPDSVRIGSSSSSTSIASTAFIRPDGFVVLVLYNKANYASDVDVDDPSRGVIKLTIPPKSIHTLLFK